MNNAVLKKEKARFLFHVDYCKSSDSNHQSAIFTQQQKKPIYDLLKKKLRAGFNMVTRMFSPSVFPFIVLFSQREQKTRRELDQGHNFEKNYRKLRHYCCENHVV